jgi:hypothetical protein
MAGNKVDKDSEAEPYNSEGDNEYKGVKAKNISAVWMQYR